ncbi:hypothetical protein ABPG77_002137 [Micractinium sp. CCAP 211/92]
MHSRCPCARVPCSYIKHSRLDPQQGDAVSVVELTFAEGRWQPVQPALSPPSPLPSLAFSGHLGSMPLAASQSDARLSNSFSQRASNSSGGSFTRQQSGRSQSQHMHRPPSLSAVGAGAAGAAALQHLQHAQHAQHAGHELSARFGARVVPVLPSTGEGDESGSGQSS